MVATVRLPTALGFLDGSVLFRQCDQVAFKELTILTVQPDQVDQVTTVALDLFPADQRSRLTVVSESDRLATARHASDAANLSAGRLMTIVAPAGTLLTNLTLGAAIVNRRKHFGRRRAIGASPAYISALVLGEPLLITVAAMVITSLLFAAQLSSPIGSASGAYPTG